MDFSDGAVQGFNVVDLVVLLLIGVSVLHGVFRGIGRTAGGALGLVLGLVLALQIIPHVDVISTDRWAQVVTLAVVLVVCMLGGQALGEALLGRLLGTPPRSSTTATVLDRTAGGALGLAIGVVVVLALAGVLRQVPVPALAAQLEGSRTVQTMQRLMPAPVLDSIQAAQEHLAGAPAIREIDALLYPPVEPPRTEVDDPEVTAASASTVRILGSATACGTNQAGSGFVTAPGQVVTNAHVLQGTDGVTVFTPEGQSLTAEVVRFEPQHDLAVLSVPDLALEPLSLAGADALAQLGSGTEAAFIGYPQSGPLSIGPATVQGSAYTEMGSVDGSQPVRVTQFAGEVQQGNSGGPLVDMDGHVIGVVFGKAVDDPAGYAVDAGTLEEVLSAAADANQPVDTGTCSAG